MYLYCSTANLNANVRVFNLHVKSVNFHKFILIVHTSKCILFLPKCWRWQTELTQLFFILLLDWHTIYQHSLPSANWCIRKDLKKKELFFLSHCHHFLSRWLTNTRDIIRKNMTGFLGNLFLECRRLLHVWIKFWFRRKSWFLWTISAYSM